MKFSGLGVAMITPLDSNGNIDEKGLINLTKHLIDNGTNYLVVQGTTGESAVMSINEKQKTLDIISKANAGRLPIVFGVGGNNTQEVANSFAKFDLSSVDAILSVSPAYNKPTQEGMYQHFKQVSIASPLPIILYNVPSRTASNMTAETTLRLANDFDNIIGIKEASGDFDQVMQLVKDKSSGFEIISGDDMLTVPLVSIGVTGLISVIGNAFPKEISCMVNSALVGNFSLAKEIHYRYLDIMNAIFAEGNPSGIKEVLSRLGICGDTLRLPLVNVSTSIKKILKGLVEGLIVEPIHDC